MWHSLQGFWRVEAVHYDLDTTFFAPEDPNFIEIHGDTIRQYYLINAPKTPVSAPNRADLEEFFKEQIKPYEERLKKLEELDKKKDVEISLLKAAIEHMKAEIEKLKAQLEKNKLIGPAPKTGVKKPLKK